MEVTLKYRSRIVIGAIAPFLSKEKRILDIGCGNGVVSDEIRSHFGCQLVGTDILSYLRRPIEFVLMKTPDALEFGDKAFDFGLFIDVLHHMPFERQIALIKEARRVCRGVLIFEVKPTLLAKTVDFLANQLHNHRMPLALTHRTKQEWMRLFEEQRITAEFFEVRKPAFWPSTNYLFFLP